MDTHSSRPVDREPLSRLTDRFATLRVAVVGDVIADEFVYGRVGRVSREAPVLILSHDSTVVRAGGAGNAASNVAALSGHARLVGVVGNDPAGVRLVETLAARVDLSRLVRVEGYRTPQKTRILAGTAHSVRQQVVRIDREPDGVFTRDARESFERAAVEAASAVDAVVVSDYGLGLVTPSLVERLYAVSCRRRGARAVPILVDSRYDLLAYTHATLVTPNELELEAALGVSIGESPRTLEAAGRQLLSHLRVDAALVTRGSHGMALFERHQPTVHIPIYGANEVADVTGAGDTVIATMALALAAGGTNRDAARLANFAAGLVVMKHGTATVSCAELRRALESERPDDLGLASTA